MPNAQGNVNTALPGSQFTIHALRAIADGEEITISYLHDELAIRSVRQQRLREGYGFECACELCSTVDLGESHQRRLNTRKMMARFTKHQSGPDTTTRELFLTKALIETYELEGLAGRELGSLYFAAASLAAKLGQGKEALVLGAKGLQIEEDAVGLDSPLYAASLSALRKGHYERSRLTSDLSTPSTESSGLSYEPWI